MSTEAKSKKLLMILALCAFLVGLDSLVVSPLIPAISASTNIPLDVGGLLVTAYALFYGLSAPLFGPISDRWGRKNMIITGMLVFGVGTALTAVGNNLTTLIAFRAVAGLGGAMIMPSVFALVGDTFLYEQRGRAMGVIMGAMVGSTILGVPLGSLFAQLGSWRGTFWAIGFLALIMVFVLSIGIPKAPPKKEVPVTPSAAYVGQFRTVFSNPSVFFSLLSMLLWSAGLQGMFAYVGVYYKKNFDLDVGQIGLIILVAGLGSVVGNMVGGRISDRIGKKAVVSLASVFAAAGVLGFSSLTHYLLWAIFVHVLWSTAIGFGQSSITALISELSPRVRGTVLSLNSSAMYIGMTAATAISAALLHDGSFLRIGVMCAVASLLVMPIMSLLVKEHAVDSPGHIAETKH